MFALSFFYAFPYSRADDAQQREVQLHIQRAQSALKANDAETAVREFNAILKLDPKNIDARANLGVIAYMQGHYPEAAESFRKVLGLQPSLWNAQALLGMCEKHLGHSAAARTWLEKSFPHLEGTKLRVQAGMELVELDYQTGEKGKVVDPLTTLRQLDPQNVDVLYATYRTFSDLAGGALDALALVAPDSPRMHLIIAEHLVNEGDRKGAILEYRKALDLDPHLRGAHFELGEALLEGSKSPEARKEAEEDFKTELALNPWDVRAECRLGDLYQSDASLDLDAAYKSFARALQIQPNDVEAQIGMGKVLAKRGQPQEAVKYLVEASSSDPVNPRAHYQLSQVYRRLGRVAEADNELQRFEYLRKSKERIHGIYQEMHQIVPGEQPLDPDSQP